MLTKPDEVRDGRGAKMRGRLIVGSALWCVLAACADRGADQPELHSCASPIVTATIPSFAQRGSVFGRMHHVVATASSMRRGL